MCVVVACLRLCAVFGFRDDWDLTEPTNHYVLVGEKRFLQERLVHGNRAVAHRTRYLTIREEVSA